MTGNSYTIGNSAEIQTFSGFHSVGTCIGGYVLDSALPAGLITLPTATTNAITLYSTSAALTVANGSATGKIYALQRDDTTRYTTTG